MKVCLSFVEYLHPKKLRKTAPFSRVRKVRCSQGSVDLNYVTMFTSKVDPTKKFRKHAQKIAKTQGSSAPNITRGNHNQRMKILKPTVALLLVWKLAHHWHMPFGQILLLQSHQVFFSWPLEGRRKRANVNVSSLGGQGGCFKKAAGIWAYIFKWESHFRWLKEIDPERGFKTWYSAWFLWSFSDTVVTAAIIGNLPFLIGNFEVSWHTHHVYPSNVCPSVLAADLAKSPKKRAELFALKNG